MERCTSTRRIFDGHVLNLRVDNVLFDDGVEATREVVEHRGASVIIPLLENNHVLLVRQYRYAVGKELLEIPAGTCDIGESPEDCAKRELQEETGFTCGNLEKILECYVAPGYSSELIHFYVASALRKAESQMELDEAIMVERIELEQVLKMIKENIIVDAKTVAGMLAYLTYYLHKA